MEQDLESQTGRRWIDIVEVFAIGVEVAPLQKAIGIVVAHRRNWSWW